MTLQIISASPFSSSLSTAYSYSTSDIDWWSYRGAPHLKHNPLVLCSGAGSCLPYRPEQVESANLGDFPELELIFRSWNPSDQVNSIEGGQLNAFGCESHVVIGGHNTCMIDNNEVNRDSCCHRNLSHTLPCSFAVVLARSPTLVIMELSWAVYSFSVGSCNLSVVLGYAARLPGFLVSERGLNSNNSRFHGL